MQYFADYAEEIPGESTNMLSSVAKETQCYVIGGSIPERDSGKLYNTSTSFGPDGALLAKHRKVGIIWDLFLWYVYLENQMRWLITGHAVMFCNSTGWIITEIGSRGLNNYFFIIICLVLLNLRVDEVAKKAGCWLILTGLTSINCWTVSILS